MNTKNFIAIDRGATLLLKLAISCLGLLVIAICVFALPRTIGTITMDGYDPILLGMYVTAVPFLYALYHAIKLLKYVDNKQAFSNASVKSLRYIKYSAVCIGMIYALAMPYIFYVADKDDAPGVVAIGLVIIGISLTVSAAAGVFQRLVHGAVILKSENDLTV